MTDSIEEGVRAEVERFKSIYGDDWGSYFFNNFHGNLPGGYRTVPNPPDFLNRRLYENNPRASERIKPQTVGEFQRECSSAVEESGIRPEDITAARRSGRNKELFEMLLPIYLILRRRGYNHYPDITS